MEKMYDSNLEIRNSYKAQDTILKENANLDI
jgi:hypothetical protein